jgi:UDP-3-O-[3-hydroxymyristoyl] glucosamine N-acyltransferase
LGGARHEGLARIVTRRARRLKDQLNDSCLTKCSAPPNSSELEHTAHSKLFETDKYVWEALKADSELPPVPASSRAVLGELVGKPFVSGSVFIGSGTIVEQGAMLKGPAWIGENCHIRAGCYLRENVIVEMAS